MALPLGGSAKVFLMNCVSPSEFWVVPAGDFNYIAGLKEKLREYYKEVSSLKHPLNNILIGDIFALKSSDDIWCRGQVEYIYSEIDDGVDGVANGDSDVLVDLRDVDGGKLFRKIIPKESCYILEPSLAKLKFMAVRCRLNRVICKDDSLVWSERAINLFRKFAIPAKPMHVYVVGFISNTHIVNLFTDENTNVNVADMLIKANVAYDPNKLDFKSIESENLTEMILKIDSLRFKVVKEVIIPHEYFSYPNKCSSLAPGVCIVLNIKHIVTPNQILATVVSNNFVKLEKLEMDMNEYYLKHQNDDLQLDKCLLFALKCKILGTWQRVFLLDVENAYGTVIGVDHGFIKCAPLKDLKKLDEKFTKFPFQSIFCSLNADIHCWTSQDVDYFKYLTIKSICRSDVLYVNEQNTVIIDFNLSSGQNAKLAILKFVESSRRNLNLESVSSEPSIIKTKNCVDKVSSVPTFENADMKIDVGTKICITHINSTSDFYAIVEQDDYLVKFREMLKELKNYCSKLAKSKVEVDNLTTGKPVAGLYQNIWNRATVECDRLLENDYLSLFFVDLGKVEKVRLAHIKILPESFITNLQVHCFKCSLSMPSHLKKEISSKIVQTMFKESFENALCMVKSSKLIEGVWFLDLLDEENDNISVIDCLQEVISLKSCHPDHIKPTSVNDKDSSQFSYPIDSLSTHTSVISLVTDNDQQPLQSPSSSSPSSHAYKTSNMPPLSTTTTSLASPSSLKSSKSDESPSQVLVKSPTHSVKSLSDESFSCSIHSPTIKSPPPSSKHQLSSSSSSSPKQCNSKSEMRKSTKNEIINSTESLRSDDFIQIVHITDIFQFFVQKCDEKSATMLNNLLRYLNEAELVPVGEIKVNDIVVAPFDGVLFRATVSELLQEDNAKLHFIDYGNESVEHLSLLHQLPDCATVNVPCLAYKCTLKGLSKESLEMSTAVNKLFAEFCGNKVFKVDDCFYDETRDVFVVDIVDAEAHQNVSSLLLKGVQQTSSDDADKENIISTNSSNEEYSMKKKPSTELPVNEHDIDDRINISINSSISNNIDTTKRLNVEKDTSETPFKINDSVTITYITNLNDFYINDTETVLNKLVELTKDLWDECSQTSKKYKPKMEGEIVAAMSDHLWNRARVVEIMKGGNFKVNMIDYGNDEIVTSESIRNISEDMTTYPLSPIIKCSLVTEKCNSNNNNNNNNNGEEEEDDDESFWTPEANKWFKDNCEWKSYNIVNIYQRRNSPKQDNEDILYSISLKLDSNQTLTEYLIDNGYSVTKKKINDKTTNEVKPPDCKKITENEGDKTAVDTLNCTNNVVDTNPTIRNLNSPSKPNNSQDLTKNNGRIYFKDLDELSITTDINCEITVPYKPDLFWCQHIDILVEMQMVISPPESLPPFPPYHPHVNEICFGLYEDYSDWYRMKVVKINDDDNDGETVDVHLIDFGDDATIPLTHLLPLPQHMKAFPPLAFLCSLHGIQPPSSSSSSSPALKKSSDWSEEAIQTFKDLVREQLVVVKCIEVGKHKRSVTVVNSSEKNVADLLVDLGFAGVKI